MKSMTGFGRGKAEFGEFRVIAEIQSVNKKGLEISVSYPREWQELESTLQERVQSRIQRGKIQGQIRITGKGTENQVDFLNVAETDRAWEQLQQLANRYQVPFNPDLSTLVQWMQFALGRATAPVLSEMRDTVIAALNEALEGVVTMREHEGTMLLKDVTERLDVLQECHSLIVKQAPQGVVRYREHLMSRLQQAGLEIDLEDDRFLREVAMFAERSDITEELTRLGSHFSQMRQFFKETEPIGRKLEFLLQEIHREFNTIGSKCTQSDISREVIRAKHEIDRLREQALNVE